ncbi:hypothetical protein X975_05769, partial [Stegodyphus mimosarum]
IIKVETKNKVVTCTHTSLVVIYDNLILSQKVKTVITLVVST